MPEVEEGLVEQVDDQEELAWPEMSADPKHDEAESEEVVQNEVASNIGSTGDKSLICRPQISHIVCLQDQNNDPVNARRNSVQAKRCPHMTVLTPDCVAVVAVAALIGSSESVVNADNKHEEP